jgi:spore germination cell wall hydrolase CwlJ-like protein
LLTNPNKLAIIDKLRDATHYHATYVKPKWSESLVRVAQIGDHVFYRMKH